MTEKNLLRIGFFGVLLGCLVSFSACGSDSSSSSGDDPTSVESSDSEGGDTSADSGSDGSSQSSKPTGSSGSTVTSSGSGSAAQKSETVSGKEALMDAQKIVNGTCGPSPAKIEKGEIATWEFYRSAGEVYNQIMAPFVWSFTGAKTESLQGNGLNSVNVRYTDAGTYTAKLNVDGNEVTCDPLQVQGIPITIASCEPKQTTVNAGGTISWTVEASSDAEIIGYTWTSTFGTTSGDGTTTGSLPASADMHKQNVTVTVTVTNKDNTSESYLCNPATVLDPEAVDMVLTVGDMNGDSKYSEPNRTSLPDEMFIPANTPMVVQVPTTAKSSCIIMCNPRVGSDYNSMKVTWDGTELSSFAYLDPNTTGCAPGKKYTVESNVTALCLVNP